MAKKDQVESNDTETDEAPAKTETAKKPDLTGLVKMQKGDVTIHAHPDVVSHHKKKGWK